MHTWCAICRRPGPTPPVAWRTCGTPREGHEGHEERPFGAPAPVGVRIVGESNVPNADLYQLLAYATALDLPGGLLIYAKGERPPDSYVDRAVRA